MHTTPRVIVTRRLPATVEEQLSVRFDAALARSDAGFGSAMLRQAMSDADALVCSVIDCIDAEVLSVADQRVRIIASFGAGLDHIDLAAAARAGIVVTNTPDVLTDDTADLALALVLMAARRVGEGERLVRAGAWEGWRPTQMLGRRVTGATLGIIGMGRIGQAVARRAVRGFGMTVCYWQPRALAPEREHALGVQRCSSLRELLESADVVSLHCPLTSETRGLIGAEALAAMKRGSILVNTARGGIVDEGALARALREGLLAAAALDVYEREPRVHEGLLGLENVILLPHLGSATVESREAMGLRVVENLVTFFQGGEPPDRVPQAAGFSPPRDRVPGQVRNAGG